MTMDRKDQGSDELVAEAPPAGGAMAEAVKAALRPQSDSKAVNAAPLRDRDRSHRATRC